MPNPIVGIEALTKLQFARLADSDSDDTIPSVEIWRGPGARIEDTRDLHVIEEDVGILVGTDRTNTSLYGGKIAIPATPGTYEQFPHLLEMSIKAATATLDSGEVYTYTYPFPTTATQTLKPYSFEGGDNVQAETLNYVHCLDWTLSGEGGKEWMMSANLFGKQVANASFTSLSTLLSVNHMNFSKTQLYIDADSDPFGTSVVSNSLLKASINYNANLVGVPTAEGVLTWTFVKTPMPDITATITFEHDAGSVTQKGFWRTETPKLIRFKNSGSAFASPSSTYPNRLCQIDLAGKWMKFKQLGTLNGNNVYEGEFKVMYNATAATAGNILIANSRTSLG